MLAADEETSPAEGRTSVDSSRLDDPIFDKPVPRHPKTDAERARIEAQNRRREYLERNPKYYDDPDHELADPLRYERLVKRFQTPAERQAEGRAKGYGRVLEADLARGEQRLAQLQPGSAATPDDSDDGSSGSDDVVDKQHGRQRWRDFLTERFVRGGDVDFDYAPVDDDAALDVLAERDAEDAWFDDEEPGWDPAKVDRIDEATLRQRRGETGIQDF